MYEISKQRLLQIAKDSPKSKIKIKQWYPDVFDFKKGWYIMLSGESVYQLYLNDSEQSRCYGTMNGGWGSSFGYHSDWIQNRIDDSEVLDLLVKAGVKYGVIESDTNTSLWTYDEENDSIKDGEAVVPTQMGIIKTLREAQPVRQGTLRRDVGDRRDANGDILITGRWYTDNGNHLMLYEGDLSNSKGFYDGNWGSTWCFPHPESSIPAPRELVQSVLRQECINRGYNSNNFLSFAGNYHRNHPIQIWYYDDVSDSMYAAPHGEGDLCMYKKGLWADINNNETAIEINNTPNDNQWWEF